MALWILLGMLFIVPIAALSLRSITMENEVHNWVSSDNPWTQAYRWFESNFPSDEAVLFTWESAGLTILAFPGSSNAFPACRVTTASVAAG